MFSLSCVCCAFVRICLCMPCGRLLGGGGGGGGGGGWPSWLWFVVSNCEFVTFPCGILGQVWYLIVLIADLCTLTLFSSENIIKINYLRQSSGQAQEYIMMWHQSEDVPIGCRQQPPFPSYCYTWHGDSLWDSVCV